MDLAKHLGSLKERSPEQWVRTANRYLPTGGTAILVLAIAYQLAALTWVVAPGAPPPVRTRPAAPVEPSTGDAQAADVETLLHSHLFGEADKAPPTPVAEAVTDAPDTTLSLDLRGILSAGEDGGNGQAIIAANRGEDKTYRVGQAIDNASGTKLYSVYWDKVLLDRGDGRVETLRLPKELLGTPAPRAKGPMMAPPVAAPPAANQSLRSVIGQNAQKLQDIIRVAPQVDQGKVTGFRITPGKDRTTFDTLGLQPGDVVTEINGIVLDDAAKGLEAFEALGEATQANVTVLRNGAPQPLVVDTTQLQGLKDKDKEDRQ
jgi:general secretion pathway protein C